MRYEDYDDKIADLRIKAKRRHQYTDDELADRCSISVSQIAHRAGDRELPEMKFWSIVLMAEEANYEVIFREKKDEAHI